VVTPNLVDYFQAASRVKFTFTQAGPIVGPLTDADWTLSDSSDVYTSQIVHMLEAHGFNFAAFDRNHDGIITSDELTILAIDNTHDTSGAARNVDATLKNSPIRVHGMMALVSQQVDFHTMAHEVAHTIGAIDVYGIWNHECLSNGLTLMSCEPFKVDDSTVMFPDAWHRLKFGWTTAYPPGFGTGGLFYELGDETYIDDWGSRAQPAILRANPKNPNECYLFEYRSGRGYDSDVASAGVLAWHVIEDASGQPACAVSAPHCVYNAGPDDPVGGSEAWTPADGRLRLSWSDGTPIPLSFLGHATRILEQQPGSALGHSAAGSDRSYHPDCAAGGQFRTCREHCAQGECDGRSPLR
jgi:M6 family metalloprotease-like protein